jgi:hypothetical protein
MYYVALPGEKMEKVKFRYKRSGILCPSSNRQSAHQAAQFLFTEGTSYNILTASGTWIASGTVAFSYWESIMQRSVPDWNDLSALDRKLLYV